MGKKKDKGEVYEMGPQDVTRGYSRKLNMSAHGGKQYETADIFSQRTVHSVPEENSEEVGALLFKRCLDEVEATIEALDRQTLEVEETEVVPEKKKKVLDVGIKVEQEDLEEISEYVNDLTLAKSLEDLKAAVIKIKDNSAKFSAEQKGYLTAYYQKRKVAIQE